jgi:protein-tyrosine phosphatase
VFLRLYFQARNAINLTEGKFRKLVSLMAMGYRTEAISVLGKNVMQPRGLIGLAEDSITACGPEIAEALRAFNVPTNYGILVHCTQGKDRTGLIILIILLLLDVPMKAITADYVKSEPELLPEREERMKEITSIGLTEDFAGCPKDWCEKTGEFLEEKFGGVKMYCDGIGFGESEQRQLVEVLGA